MYAMFRFLRHVLLVYNFILTDILNMIWSKITQYLSWTLYSTFYIKSHRTLALTIQETLLCILV